MLLAEQTHLQSLDQASLAGLSSLIKVHHFTGKKVRGAGWERRHTMWAPFLHTTHMQGEAFLYSPAYTEHSVTSNTPCLCHTHTDIHTLIQGQALPPLLLHDGPHKHTQLILIGLGNKPPPAAGGGASSSSSWGENGFHVGGALCVPACVVGKHTNKAYMKGQHPAASAKQHQHLHNK